MTQCVLTILNYASPLLGVLQYYKPADYRIQAFTVATVILTTSSDEDGEYIQNIMPLCILLECFNTDFKYVHTHLASTVIHR